LTTPTPTKRLPVYRKLGDHSAMLLEVAGWLVPEHFGSPEDEAQAVRSSVGILDQSWFTKLEIKGQGLTEFLGQIEGVSVPLPGRAALTPPGYVCRLSPPHALVVLDAELPLPAWVTSARPGACVHLFDRTNGYASFLVCGPAAAEVLRKLASLDLREGSFPDLSCATGPIASVRTVLVRKDRARLPWYELFVAREYGEYLWDAVMEAGAEFKLRPFGLAAARELG
jgi:glycine cleavage system aminomethyltransferase T